MVQHNVLNWRNRRIGLSNIYRNIDPDIILINSHGVPENEPLHIPMYRIHKKNSTNTHTDGTAIAVKHNIPHKILDHFISDMLAIEIDTTTGKLIIATLYQPPARPYIPSPDFIQLFRRHTPVFMLADLNANHPTLGYRHSNTAGRQLHNLILNRTLQHIGPHFPTYFTANTSTTPDIILANYRTHHNTHVAPGPLTTSDHTPIIFTVSSSPIQIPATARPNYSQANWDGFKNDIEEKNDNHLFPVQPTLEDIDEEIDKWYDAILSATRTHIPTTYHRTLPAPTHSHETNNILIQYTTLRTHAQTHGWTRQQYCRYRTLQQTLQDALLRESNLHWSTLIRKTATQYKDPETFWRKIKNLSGGSSPSPLYLIGPNNTRKYNEEEQEELHRDVWEDIFVEDEEEDDNINYEHVREDLRHNADRTTPYHTADDNRLNNIEDPMTEEVTTEEIKFLIKKMKKTCPGSSGINKTILKNLPDAALKRLVQIYNATISAGYFPDKWKQATMRLIPKHGKNPQLACNYRPISLLEVPGKLLERAVNRRLREHLEDKNLYNINQFGFRQQRGTTHALALVTESIAHYKADKGQCHLVLRDITKAFDKVWHLGLKHKLLQLGLPTIYEKLLCDFLDDRQARIKVGSYTGDYFNLGCGVPQGSVLSPTLFVIYTRDLPPSITGQNIAYADDITQIVGYPGQSKDMIKLRTEREITSTNGYEKRWKIKTNLTKFTPIRMGQRTGEPLIVDEEPVDFQTSGKSLGLKITRTGYTQHIRERRGKAMAALIKLFRFRELPVKIKSHLVKALVLPVLDYPPIPIHTLSKTQISKLQKIQNKALRFATEQRYPYTMNTIQIHTLTKTKPVNVRMHERAIKIWKDLEELQHPTYEMLKNNLDNIRTFNKWFPSSLKSTGRAPTPKYK